MGNLCTRKTVSGVNSGDPQSGDSSQGNSEESNKGNNNGNNVVTNIIIEMESDINDEVAKTTNIRESEAKNFVAAETAKENEIPDDQQNEKKKKKKKKNKKRDKKHHAGVKHGKSKHSGESLKGPVN